MSKNTYHVTGHIIKVYRLEIEAESEEEAEEIFDNLNTLEIADQGELVDISVGDEVEVYLVEDNDDEGDLVDTELYLGE